MEYSLSTVDDVYRTLLEMIEEAQTEARFCVHTNDYNLTVTKRDALVELKHRIRDGKRDPMWARRVLVMPL